MTLANDLHAGLHEQLLGFPGQERGGWKIGLTSGAMRDSMGPGFRPFGQIRQDRIFSSGDSIRLSEAGTVGVENEVCFIFASDLSLKPTREEIAAGIRGIAPSFELNERRLQGTPTNRQKLADNLSQWGIVVGELVEDWCAIDLNELTVSMYCDDVCVGTVTSQHHIDDHLESLLALTETLGCFDLGIEKGDRVITGSYTRAAVTGPSAWRGDFGADLGEVEVRWV